MRVKTHPRSDSSTNFAAKLAPLYTGPYRVAQKLSDVNYRLADVTTGRDMGVFHVVNMEPFRTWVSGNVSKRMPVNPPLEFEEDNTLLVRESSCHTSPGEPSSDCPTDNVSDLLESDARVSLSDLFGDVTDEGASECGDPAILSDLTESHVDCVDQRYNMK